MEADEAVDAMHVGIHWAESMLFERSIQLAYSAAASLHRASLDTFHQPQSARMADAMVRTHLRMVLEVA